MTFASTVISSGRWKIGMRLESLLAVPILITGLAAQALGKADGNDPNGEGSVGAYPEALPLGSFPSVLLSLSRCCSLRTRNRRPGCT